MSTDVAGAQTRARIADLNHEITRHARLLHVLKTSMATLVPEGLDAAAFGLLITLVKGGPQRQGELAETCMLDPSTVSRYAAQLARAGYVERRPDPGDGRAVHLVASAAGSRSRRRSPAAGDVISEALSGWAPEDLPVRRAPAPPERRPRRLPTPPDRDDQRVAGNGAGSSAGRSTRPAPRPTHP